jgi:flavin-dependent dehydrogenase
LDRIIAANTPPARRVHFDNGVAVLEGSFPEFEGVDALYSPRRMILDKILVDAAIQAGVEMRESFIVEEIMMEAGRVTGIRGRSIGGTSVTEKARFVIGADGKHSMVAKAVHPQIYHEKPALSMGYYTYWEGVPVEGGEIIGRERRLMGAWPTNNGLVMTYVAWPIQEFHAFRSDIEGNLLRTLDSAGSLGERVRAGKRAERVVGTADLPNYFRKPYGPGWALVGDAGLVQDPITGQGISDAFRDAELLADALDAGFSRRRPLDQALAGYQRRRDDEALPMYEFATQLVTFTPPKMEERLLFESLVGRQDLIDRFLGVLTGSEPMNEFFAPKNLFKIMGARRMGKIMLHNLLRSKPKAKSPQTMSSSATAN